MEEIHENQLGEALSYQFEPILNENSGSSGAEIRAIESESSSDDVDFDEAFEVENSWRLKSLSWCKCGHCTLQTKTIESFCCHEKALE
ncbi:Hypothetical predicted protein [Paramuricea clavata]|uniref:Uncharacterized protein n=1 Tax=Paramuricea clavata TaxID=317549 RepID=A0A7D9EKE2_PARCT|nr:Hypothetical predicted protein [Paramuricea clavata]